MSNKLKNPFRSFGIPDLNLVPKVDVTAARSLASRCPSYSPTPLTSLKGLAQDLGVAEIHIKDERARMGLGSFKALGAAYAIATEAAARQVGNDLSKLLSDRVYVAASAGNHGLSVVAGAQKFGARSVVYLSNTVPEPFAERLRNMGGEVIRAGDTYEESMDAAENAADQNGWTLLSDSSWPGYQEMPLKVMEGYLLMAAELVDQLRTAPTHILLQAGVGGMAAAVATYCRRAWGDEPLIVIVEPEAAPALLESIRTGRVVTTSGPVSEMGRLDCKTPSMIALAGLASDADLFVTITEQDAANAVGQLNEHDIATTPSGAAGLAAVLSGTLDVPNDARLLAIVSEGLEIG